MPRQCVLFSVAPGVLCALCHQGTIATCALSFTLEGMKCHDQCEWDALGCHIAVFCHAAAWQPASTQLYGLLLLHLAVPQTPREMTSWGLRGRQGGSFCVSPRDVGEEKKRHHHGGGRFPSSVALAAWH